MKAKKRSRNNKYLYPLLIVIIGVAVYVNTWQGEFTFDDVSIVESNPLVKRAASFGSLFKPVKEVAPEYQRRDHTRGLDIGHSLTYEIFISDYWNKPDRGILYRPLTIWSYALTNGVWGATDKIIRTELFGEVKDPKRIPSRPFHVVNTFLHGLGCLLAFLLLRMTMPPLAAFLSAAIFALHPIHTEAVSGIVGRAELLSFIFYIAALILFLKPRGNTFLSVSMASVALFFGLLSKETAITFIGAALVLGYFLNPKQNSQKGISSQIKSYTNHLKKSRKGLFLLSFLAISMIYLFLRGSILQNIEKDPARNPKSFIQAMLSGGGKRTSLLDNPIIHQNLVQQKLMAVTILGNYTYQIINPLAPLSADYSYNQIKPVKGGGRDLDLHPGFTSGGCDHLSNPSLLVPSAYHFDVAAIFPGHPLAGF